MDKNITKSKREVIGEAVGHVIGGHPLGTVCVLTMVSGAVYLIGRRQGMTLGRAMGRTDGYAQATADIMVNMFGESAKDSNIH